MGDSPYKQDDPRITHQVVDRPTQDSHGANQREYIQPQWVFDSINAMVCLPIHKYRPGSVLPPHLSPFVDDSQEGYVPQYRKEVDKLVSTVAVQKGLADAAEKAAAVDESGDDEEEGSESDDDEYEKDLEAERKGVSYSTKRSREEEEDSDEEDDSGSDEEEGDDDEEEEEEEEEVALNSKKQKGVVYAPKKGSEGEDNEGALSHIMMNKKTKRLYGRMQHGLQKKKDVVERLEQKKRELEPEPKKKQKQESLREPESK
eukprot:NODE_2247_length_959_cov_72.646154_g1851_i0.p1 GENE.NODE_2247_length_959_cov_72.646154_g1851_i0~~NODE_2247_length_959_cov_72.646154_g1851_i0.p1  ORF type:complete len:268 (-),score=50.39 NODE_2247_length_959_cov_72.646154_g1851_i0:154-930(-)